MLSSLSSLSSVISFSPFPRPVSPFAPFAAFAASAASAVVAVLGERALSSSPGQPSFLYSGYLEEMYSIRKVYKEGKSRGNVNWWDEAVCNPANKPLQDKVVFVLFLLGVSDVEKAVAAILFTSTLVLVKQLHHGLCRLDIGEANQRKTVPE